MIEPLPLFEKPTWPEEDIYNDIGEKLNEVIEALNKLTQIK